MPQQIQIGAGISVGAGISIGPTQGAGVSLTIGPGDWNFGQRAGLGGGQALGPNGTGGFDLNTGSLNLIDPIYQLTSPTGGIVTTITDAWTAAGYDINYAYAWRASFNTPGTSCLVRLSWDGNYLRMIVIDETDTDWQGGDASIGTALGGQFVLPVTFTPYSPATQLGANGNWC